MGKVWSFHTLFRYYPHRQHCIRSSRQRSHIMDIIGEKKWMKGVLNCICNIASGRKVSLTWGSKKKSSNRSQLSIGDNVIVSNHGTKWEHRAKILQMNEDRISVLVKRYTSLKRENVFLNDCRKFDVENTSLRKRSATDFFAPLAEERIVHESSLSKRKSTDFLAPVAREEIVHKS